MLFLVESLDHVASLTSSLVSFDKSTNIENNTFVIFVLALQQQVSTVVSAAQSALSGALGSLSALGSNILDASKPHWEQLQEQLVGHGLNVLGSLSETINNVHGSITGGR